MTSQPEAAREWLKPPPDTPEYMMQAWLGALFHAIGDDDIVAAFRADTRNKWTPGKTSIERMIDRAAGSEERFLKEFVTWFNANVWGPIDE